MARLAQWGVNLTVLAVLALVFTPAGDWLGDSLVDVDPLARADYIVVLGGRRERAVEAANLYRRGWAPKVIVTSTKASAPGLAKVVEAYGVPKEDILIDSAAVRTASHPKTVAAVPGVTPATDRFIIVTSSYHTSRSRACFELGGYKHICMHAPGWRDGGRHGAGPGAWSLRAETLAAKIYEVLAWAMYSVRGWV